MAKSKENHIFIAGGHHARFIDERVPMHIISRVFQGRHLLRPCAELNNIIVGVVARAKELYPLTSLYAMAFMSNHMHLLLQGPSEQVPYFIGFIKREISRRWGDHPDVDWHGTMWHEYLATALPTPESQIAGMRYILSQGVKENLVERPQDWPGVHCAASLMTGKPLTGRWFDATGFVRAQDAAKRLVKPAIIERSDFEKTCTLAFDALPTWEAFDASERYCEVRKLVTNIVEEAAENRKREGKNVLGAAKVKTTPLERISKLPPLPWFENRRRMICWANPRDESVRTYLAQYWAFQEAFAEASRLFRAGDLSAQFPPRAFRPVTHRAAA